MTIHDETYTLQNGVKIPELGLGTWLIDDDAVEDVVAQAIADGYRHIDTAQAYGNEAGVGRGVRKSGVDRADLFVTTKLAAEHKDYAEAAAAIDESLQKMGLDYIDMMIIHSPEPWANFRDGDHYFAGNLAAWRALEDAYTAGKLRAIGVSNFEQVDLQNILDNGHVQPQVNQVLAHIGNMPNELIAFNQAHGILTEAYSPVAHGAMLGNAQMRTLADKYGVSVAQLAIKFCLQKGLLPLPKSGNPEHMRDNAQLDFAINAADMTTLSAIKFADYGKDKAFPVYSGKKD
ncbi:aldo/keto reductase [Lacticaseibacillus songhuajiangensis]|uniref:aldo/keto reductase n=1 Tax=Lacticaseibacillus songhuajiangensis TaxID=1296539 RepID=UPI000F7B1B83|nr:aldo/keto reductase [Lacticaseibacillus songhuajiangensis]